VSSSALAITSEEFRNVWTESEMAQMPGVCTGTCRLQLMLYMLRDILCTCRDEAVNECHIVHVAAETVSPF
jgi:hypothetical protein